MFRELGWFSVPNRINFNKAVFTYRTLNELTPEYISTLLKPVSQVHILNLRSTNNGSLYVPKSRTTIYDGSFSCSAPRLWNTLPQTVRNAGSLNVFKKNIKAHLLHWILQTHEHFNLIFNNSSIWVSSHNSGLLVPTLQDMNHAVRLHVQGHAVWTLVSATWFPVRLCKAWVPDYYFALIVTINMLCQY